MMSKLRKIPALISVLRKEPYLINLILKSNEVAKRNFIQKYPNITALPQIELKDLNDQVPETEIHSFIMDGGSLITDLQLLMTLANRPECHNYLEIGTWRGESVYNVAKILQDCTTINLPASEMKKMGFNGKYIGQHGILSSANAKISHVEANTSTLDFTSFNRKFDLIFIDGDHSYEMVHNDTKKVFQHLVHENSVVVWHDYAYNPQKIRYEVFRAILDGIGQENQRNLYHVKNTMCAVFWRGKITSTKFDEFEIPEKIYSIDLNDKLFKSKLQIL